MSEQGDAFVRLVLKGDPEMSGWTVRDAATWFVHRYGSQRRASAELGIPRSTLGGWFRGATPKPGRGEALIARARTERSRVSRLGDPGTLVPLVTQERRRPTRSRDVSGAQLKLREGTTEAARQVWASTGDSAAALRTFVHGIQEPWYRAQLARGAGDAQLEDLADDDYVMESDYGATIG